jgi:hypothetical protein
LIIEELKEELMLKLDPYSDGLLFQCDRCQRVGELIIQGREEEGQFYCWNCLARLQNLDSQKVTGQAKTSLKELFI